MLSHIESLSHQRLIEKYNGSEYTYATMIIEELINPSVLSHIKVAYREMILFISNEPTVTSQYPKQFLSRIIKFLFEKQIERKRRWDPMLCDLLFARMIMQKEKEKDKVIDILNSVESSVSSSYESNVNDDDSSSSKEILESNHVFFNEALLQEIEEGSKDRFNKEMSTYNENSSSKTAEASIKDILRLIKMMGKTERKEQSKMNSPIKEKERKSQCFDEEIAVKRITTKKKMKKLSTRRFFPNIYDPKKEYEINSIAENDKSISHKIEQSNQSVPFRSLAKFYITSQHNDKVLNERKKILGDSLSYYLSQKEEKRSKNIQSKFALKRPSSNIRLTRTKVISPPQKESFRSSFYITPINISDIRSPFTKKEKNNKLPIFTSEAIRNAIYNSNRIKKLHCKTQSFSKSSRRVIKLKHPVIYNKYK